MTKTLDLDMPRRAGRRTISALTGLLGLGAILAAYLAGNDPQTTGVIAVFFVGVCLGAKRLFPAFADYAVTLAIVGQTALLTAAFAGHPWQLDSHMVYFVVLATLILLINPKVLILGAGLIALHHAAFSIAMPALVYPSSALLDNIMRTAFHGGVVVVETATLIFAVHTRLKMAKASKLENDRLQEATAQTEAALSRAAAANEEALASQKRAQEQAARAEAALAQSQTSAQQKQEADAAAKDAASALARTQAEAAQMVGDVVRQLSNALSALAAKKLDHFLTTPFPPQYEDIRTDYNIAVRALSQTIAHVATQITQLKTDANVIAETSSQQAVRFEKRSHALGNISESLKTLGQSSTTSAQNAQEARETVSVSHRHADEGMVVVGQAINAMKEIEESADEIRKIVSLIEDIAFQTNLLALNAGVEAARAGEAGRGFAVVATEVRALALRSSDSANEIKSLIAKSDHQVQQGVSLVKRSGDALEQILNTVSLTNEQVATISDNVQDQSRQLGDVGGMLAEISNMANQDAAAFEETTATTLTMDQAADHLADAVSVFSHQTATDHFPNRNVA